MKVLIKYCLGWLLQKEKEENTVFERNRKVMKPAYTSCMGTSGLIRDWRYSGLSIADDVKNDGLKWRIAE
jgi:hypothetical protein